MTDYTILNDKDLNIVHDTEQTSGSDLLIKIDKYTNSDVDGFESYSILKKANESFTNNVHKEAQKQGATAGGTVSSGFIEVYLAHGKEAVEIEKKGLGSEGIKQIEICKTIVINEKRKPIFNIYYRMCNIVHFTYNFGAYQFLKFSCQDRTFKYSQINQKGEDKGKYSYTYSIKSGSVKD